VSKYKALADLSVKQPLLRGASLDSSLVVTASEKILCPLCWLRKLNQICLQDLTFTVTSELYFGDVRAGQKRDS
jgi:hypothetical protein